MSKLFAIVAAHETKWDVRPAALARRCGTSPQTFTNWKKGVIKSLPESALLSALADATGVHYREVIDAALEDIGYIPKPAPKEPRKPAAKSSRKVAQVKLRPPPASRRGPRGTPQ